MFGSVKQKTGWPSLRSAGERELKPRCESQNWRRLRPWRLSFQETDLVRPSGSNRSNKFQRKTHEKGLIPNCKNSDPMNCKTAVQIQIADFLRFRRDQIQQPSSLFFSMGSTFTQFCMIHALRANGDERSGTAGARHGPGVNE